MEVVAMTVFIALLRAVNVGGTGKISMKDLKAALEGSGLTRVTTYIASGNIVFSYGRNMGEAKKLIADVLSKRFGMEANNVIVRSPSDLQKVIDSNPFGDAAELRPNRLIVVYLDGLPDRQANEALANYKGPEILHLSENHLYIDYKESIGNSKLTPAFLNRTLKVAGTGRNWNTTLKLLELAGNQE